MSARRLATLAFERAIREGKSTCDAERIARIVFYRNLNRRER